MKLIAYRTELFLIHFWSKFKLGDDKFYFEKLYNLENLSFLFMESIFLTDGLVLVLKALTTLMEVLTIFLLYSVVLQESPI